MSLPALLGVIAKSGLLTLDVMLILFGAILFLGFEFPSVFGGAIGLAIAMLYLKPQKTSFS